jgi:DNA-binding response OmpR family regulator
MGMANRILVIDDDPAVTSVLRRGLTYEGYNVDIAASGTEGLQSARDHTPNLIILDIMMPDIDGLEVLRRLRAAGDKIPVLMLTAKDAPQDEVIGLDQGADDYVVKPFEFDVLLAHVRALLRRQETDHPAILSFADLSLDTGTHQLRREKREIEVTTTEYKLLLLFLEHPRQVLDREMLMDRVWGYDFSGDTNVLETYIKQLRQKLEAAGEARLIHTVRGVGYVLREE